MMILCQTFQVLTNDKLGIYVPMMVIYNLVCVPRAESILLQFYNESSKDSAPILFTIMFVDLHVFLLRFVFNGDNIDINF